MDIKDILVNYSAEEYGDQYKPHGIEQYKLYLEFTDRMSTRRYKANSFFLTINTVMIGFAGYVHTGGVRASAFFWLIGLAGMILCYTWYRLIQSFSQLNKGRFEIIHALESELPFSIYRAEWDVLGRGKNTKKYRQFSTVEGIVPWVFLFLYALVFIISLPWDIIS